MLTFISLIDLSTKKDEGNFRKVSLSHSNTSYPGRLCLLGGLSHNTNITLDKENAQKMIDFCQSIIDNGIVAELEHNSTEK